MRKIKHFVGDTFLFHEKVLQCKKKGEVKTDDNQNIGLYVFVGLASLAAIIYIRKRYFKKHL